MCCERRERCAIKRKEQEKKGSIQTNTTAEMTAIQYNLKPKQPSNQTKPKPTQNHNNQKKTTKQKCLLVFNLEVLVIHPSFKKEKDVSPGESLNRSE